ncbi:hypothetical protein [Actinoplanes sp. GCM10030250]|uniref:hypothetical protein n=1 Tax=Actinoplanes sp. GCM10030250 TaxID=3273376 RepID=UPI0036073631
MNLAATALTVLTAATALGAPPPPAVVRPHPSPSATSRLSLSAATAPPSAGPRVAAAPRVARQWTTTDAAPIGRPLAVDGVLVGYVMRARHVYARGIAPATGRMLWEQEVSPSLQPTGSEIAPHRVGNHAVLLQPEPAFSPDHARLTVLDPRTGRELHRTPAMLFSSPPESCFAGRSVCALATPETGDPVRGYRLNLDSGAFIPYAETAPQGARHLGPQGLIALGPTTAEQIALLRDGTLHWQRPLPAVFPRVPATTGTRWTLHTNTNDAATAHAANADADAGADADAYTGSGYARGTRSKTAVTLDLARDPVSAGLDATDGHLLWRQYGTVIDCGGRIALPGRGVRCRYRGTVTTTNASRTTTSAALKVNLEGFDPRTGKSRWSVPLGPATALAVGAGRLPVADENTIVAPAPTGPLLIDLRTGSTSKPAAGAVVWCPKAVRFPYRTATTMRTGGDVFTPCTPSGRPSVASPPPATARAIGTVVANFAVIPTPTGYQGTEVTP